MVGMSLCCSTSNVLMKRLPNTNPATNELLDHPLTETVMNWRRRRSEDVRFPPLFTELDASRGIASSLLGTTTALTAEKHRPHSLHGSCPGERLGSATSTDSASTAMLILQSQQRSRHSSLSPLKQEGPNPTTDHPVLSSFILF